MDFPGHLQRKKVSKCGISGLGLALTEHKITLIIFRVTQVHLADYPH